MKNYYIKIKLKEKYDNRKIWYLNNYYICDCVNTTFPNKEEAEGYLQDLLSRKKYPFIKSNIETVTTHYTLH